MALQILNEKAKRDVGFVWEERGAWKNRCAGMQRSAQWLILNEDACVKESASLLFCTASLVALDDASRKHACMSSCLPIEIALERQRLCARGGIDFFKAGIISISELKN
jgi:hypothetical protein